jgi:AcrR family transcriptional regulator
MWWGAGMSESEIRKIILEAALNRFVDYGYGKTTVAEIAKDCDMSSGNIYRYYENKEAIAIAGVEEKMKEKARTCEDAVDPSAPAMEQIRQYLLTRLRFTHAMACGKSHTYELVQLISERHQDTIEKYDARSIEWMARVIEHGIEHGEFRPQDAGQAAASIFVATLGFCVPVLMCRSEEQMESDLNALVDLLYQGLKA